MKNCLKSIPDDLSIAKELIYNPIGLCCDHIVLEAENKAYDACQFTMNNRFIHFRSGKITPTKIGQFVTFWKRAKQGSIIPYDIADSFDFLVVSVRNKADLGQFVFPKSILGAYDILSKDGKGGKRAMRIYPPWDTPDSRQALTTQKWQLMYFFEINPQKPIDKINILKLFS